MVQYTGKRNGREECAVIRIGDLHLPPEGDLEQLRKRAARALGMQPGRLGELTVVRQSIDARDKGNVHYVCTVEVSLPD